MMKKPFILLLLPLLLSCEKEITVGYREAERLYVAEARLTQNGARVRLCTTQRVADNSIGGHGVENAVVVLGSRDGLCDTLRHTAGGSYTSNTAGVPGTTYDMDIYVDGRHFSSSSTMQPAPDLQSFRFVWQDVLTARMLIADLRIQDAPDRTDYYYVQIFRGGVSYRWTVLSDEDNEGGELQQLFLCGTESDMEGGDEDALREGDLIRVEVRAIDRASYDYLYSLQVMGGAGTNPIQNFSGGCLGYFSAYSFASLNIIFRRSGVVEE